MDHSWLRQGRDPWKSKKCAISSSHSFLWCPYQALPHSINKDNFFHIVPPGLTPSQCIPWSEDEIRDKTWLLNSLPLEFVNLIFPTLEFIGHSIQHTIFPGLKHFIFFISSSKSPFIVLLHLSRVNADRESERLLLIRFCVSKR